MGQGGKWEYTQVMVLLLKGISFLKFCILIFFFFNKLEREVIYCSGTAAEVSSKLILFRIHSAIIDVAPIQLCLRCRDAVGMAHVTTSTSTLLSAL